MSAAIEKILDKVPYFDGGFRRRITSGSIIAIVIYLLWVISGNDTDVIEILSEDFTILIIIFLVIYAIGNLMELLADVVISAAIERYSNFNFFKGKKEKSLDLSTMLDEQGYAYFKVLPESVKRGLENPYGKYRETSWSYFCNFGTTSEIELARKLRSRNQDVLVIVTTITLMLFSFSTPFIYDLYVGYEGYSQQQQQGQAAEVAGYLAITLALGISSAFPMIFFAAYLSSVKASVQTLLQYKALPLIEITDNLVNSSIKSVNNTLDN